MADKYIDMAQTLRNSMASKIVWAAPLTDLTARLALKPESTVDAIVA